MTRIPLSVLGALLANVMDEQKRGEQPLVWRRKRQTLMKRKGRRMRREKRRRGGRRLGVVENSQMKGRSEKKESC